LLARSLLTALAAASEALPMGSRDDRKAVSSAGRLANHLEAINVGCLQLGLMSPPRSYVIVIGHRGVMAGLTLSVFYLGDYKSDNDHRGE
jgi:hypothetical protein